MLVRDLGHSCLTFGVKVLETSMGGGEHLVNQEILGLTRK
jgi:hypothetical protein